MQTSPIGFTLNQSKLNKCKNWLKIHNKFLKCFAVHPNKPVFDRNESMPPPYESVVQSSTRDSFVDSSTTRF